jgi:hypothetical protein
MHSDMDASMHDASLPPSAWNAAASVQNHAAIPSGRGRKKKAPGSGTGKRGVRQSGGGGAGLMLMAHAATASSEASGSNLMNQDDPSTLQAAASAGGASTARKRAVPVTTPWRLGSRTTTEEGLTYVQEMLHHIVACIASKQVRMRRLFQSHQIYQTRPLPISATEKAHLDILAQQIVSSWGRVAPLLVGRPAGTLYTLDSHCLVMLLIGTQADTKLDWLGENNPQHSIAFKNFVMQPGHFTLLGTSKTRIAKAISCLHEAHAVEQERAVMSAVTSADTAMQSI